MGARLRALVVCGALFGQATAGPDDASDLQHRFRQAYDREDWPAAIYLGGRLAEQAPDAAAVAYDLACAHARNEDPQKAVHWLARSADAGFDNAHRARTDPDLKAVRNQPGYATALDGILENLERRLEPFKALAAQVRPPLRLPSGHDAQRPSPLIVVLHGHGGTGRGIMRAWTEVADAVGAVLVGPDALHPAPGGGYSWSSIDESAWLVQDTVARVREAYLNARLERDLRAAGLGVRREVFGGVGHSLPRQHQGHLAAALQFVCDLAPRPAASRATSAPNSDP